MMQSRTSEETPTVTTFESFFDADADAFDEDDFTDFFDLLASMRRENAFGTLLVVGDAIEGKMITREKRLGIVIVIGHHLRQGRIPRRRFLTKLKSPFMISHRDGSPRN